MCSSSVTAKPLRDRTVFAACSAKKMGELVSGLEAMGAVVLPVPVIEAVAVGDTSLLDRALGSLEEYSWIVFTSAYGVTFFMQRMKELGIRTEMPAMPKICAIGPATAATVREYGHRVELVPEQYIAEGVVEALSRYGGENEPLAGRRILLPRAKEGREVLPIALAASGAIVDLVPCYETVMAHLEDGLLEDLRRRRPDLVIFTSSSTVRNLVAILGQDEGQRLLRETTIAVLGPVTGRTTESFGKRAEILPKESTIPSLLEAIVEYYRG